MVLTLDERDWAIVLFSGRQRWTQEVSRLRKHVGSQCRMVEYLSAIGLMASILSTSTHTFIFAFHCRLIMTKLVIVRVTGEVHLCHVSDRNESRGTASSAWCFIHLKYFPLPSYMTKVLFNTIVKREMLVVVVCITVRWSGVQKLLKSLFLSGKDLKPGKGYVLVIERRSTIQLSNIN